MEDFPEAIRPVMGDAARREPGRKDFTPRRGFGRKGSERLRRSCADSPDHCDNRQLIRALARQLAEYGPEASKLRAVVNQSIGASPPRQGGILAALRHSPLVGAELDTSRPKTHGRAVEL
jgi:hypothetical protein